jgi:biotin carboxyl carrier protein
MKIVFDQTTLDLEPSGSGYIASTGDQSIELEVLTVERGKLDLLLDGQHLTAYVTADGNKRWVTVQGRTFLLTKQVSSRARGAGQAGGPGLIAPMPGLVRAINVAEGDKVRKGDTLLVIEAMKMEIRVQAQRDGIVKKLLVKQGDTVEREQLLVDMADPAS